MKSTVTKSALVLTSFLLWQATTVVAEDATSTKTSSEVSTTTDITTSSTTTASSETTASETTTSKTTSSSETIPENTTDPYFPKQPTQADLDGDKILPKGSDELTSRAFTTSSGTNAAIIKNFENGTYKLATIQKSWREYEMFPYQTLDNKGTQYKPSGIVIHETANPSSTIWGEIAYMDSHWENAFVHAFVDENNIIETHDPRYGGWGAGRIANRYFMHVELVEHSTRNSFMKSIMNNAYYMAMKLDQFGLTPSAPSGKANDTSGTLWSHAEVSNYLGGTDHGDPVGYFAKYGYSVNEYRELVAYMYDKFSLAPVIQSTTIQNVDDIQKTFEVRVQASVNSGIKEVKIPVWTQANQSDLIWYTATLQNDGSYIAKVDGKKHASVTQPFNVHAYVTGNNNKQTSQPLSSVTFDNLAQPVNVTTTIDTKDGANGNATILAKIDKPELVDSVTMNIYPTNKKDKVFAYKAANTTAGYQTNVSIGNHAYQTGTYTGEMLIKHKTGAIERKAIPNFTISGTNVKTAMYRLYNPNSGEHFYTLEAAEKNNLIKAGWKDEGTGWTAPATGDPVYRVYNPNTGDHHYTLAAGEKTILVSLGWKDEGIGFYSSKDKTKPLYRVYNPNAKAAGSHHYTANRAEVTNLVKVGWKDEGLAWYAAK